MATNATTWFYAEPETGRPYLITERLTHTFWTNRLYNIFLNCVHAEPPYKVVGQWEDVDVEMEWEVKHYFRLRTAKEEHGLITVCAEVLGFRPTLSYHDNDNHYVTEWFLEKEQANDRLQQIQGNPAYSHIQTRYRR